MSTILDPLDRVTAHLIVPDGQHRVQILVGGVLLLDDRLEDAFELEELGVDRAVEGERELDGVGGLVWVGGGVMVAVRFWHGDHFGFGLGSDVGTLLYISS